MKAFYPELLGKGANVDVQSTYPLDADGPLLSFYVRVSEADQGGRVVAAPYPNPSSADRVGHVSTHFQFDGRDHCIFLVSSSGSFVNGDRQESLRKIVDEHPDWSKRQITEALLNAGAKFGPTAKESLLAKLPIKQLESILGTIQIEYAEFTFRSQGESRNPAAEMTWSIRFRATKGGAHDDYTVTLEPFAGKMTSFGRRSRN